MRTLTFSRLVPALALIAALLACATGSTGGETPIASFSTATPGGGISVSLLTPTLTMAGVPNQGAMPIGPVATATAQAAAEAAQTATAAALIPTPTIPGIFTEPAICPLPGAPTLPAQPPAFTRFAELIVEYLSVGGAPTVLEATLRTWQALTDYGGLVRADRDFTGDGVPEVMVVAFDPQRKDSTPQPGDLFVFGCEESAYRLLYQAGYSVDRGAPVIHSADDINGDALNDLVYSVETCGETSCLNEVRIAGWSLPLESFASLLSAEVIEPYAQVIVSDVDEDGLSEVSVTTGLIPQVEAGPQRQITTIYKWDGTLYTIAEVVRPIAEYRIHLIHDADDALLAGEHSDAIRQFRAAINDDDLLAWTYPSEDLYLRTFARFRLMLAYVRAGNVNAAQTAHDDLMALYFPPPPCDPAIDPACVPPPTATPFFGPVPGTEFARLADLFWSDFSVNRNLGVACELVVSYTRVNPAALEVLNSFGYANRQYTPTDMCPWGR